MLPNIVLLYPISHSQNVHFVHDKNLSKIKLSGTFKYCQSSLHNDVEENWKHLKDVHP